MRSIIAIVLLATAASAQPLAGVRLSEIVWNGNEAVEITNYSNATVNLQNWVVQWHDGVLTTSSPLGVSIAPGEIIVVTDGAATNPVYGWVQVVPALPPVSTTSEALSVALIDGNVVTVDEVRIENLFGFNNLPQLGGVFRGLAPRSPALAGPASSSVERIWRLDSDAGADWTAQWTRSLGVENRSSGPRGSDPDTLDQVQLSEFDDSPDLIELYNAGVSGVNLQNWYLICSAIQNGSEVVLTPFPNATSFVPGEYIVLGESPAPPPEIPGGVQYIDVGTNIPFTSNEYTCVLYDDRGRCIDVFRTTGHDDLVAHNHTRPPAPWDAFVGTGGRGTAGDRAVARVGVGDTDTGSDWRPVFTRTMGSPNAGFVGPAGHGDVVDVRLNDGAGDGLALIVNAGSAAAGGSWSFVYGFGHAGGPLDPGFFLGLPFEAWLNNWTAITAPGLLSGTLDARGSARVDVGPGDIAPGLDLDTLFLIQDSSGTLIARTQVLEFDT